MIYYKKIEVENFIQIQTEILEFAKDYICQDLRYWDIKFYLFYKHTPIFSNFLFKNFRSLPILSRFYNTPPFYTMGAHTDNVANSKNKIGFNIPLLNTENTQMEFYTTPSNNMVLTTLGMNGEFAQHVKDKSLLRTVDSVEIDKPTLVRTDQLHGIVNNKSTRRLVLGLKFNGSNFDEVYKF